MIQYENLYGSRTLCTTSDRLANYLCTSYEILDKVINHLIKDEVLMDDGYYIMPWVHKVDYVRPTWKNKKVSTTITMLDESSTYKVIIAAWDVRVVQRPYETLNSIMLEVLELFKRVREADKYERS
jgi:hypothetical protein